MHGQPELIRQRDNNAALRGAIKLRQYQARNVDHVLEGLHLNQRVLADGGIHHQQRRVRRRRVELLDHTNDFFQFSHQILAVL